MSGIFKSDIKYFTMKQSSKGHNVEYLKRLAKVIKKEQGIPHHESLNVVATQYGFSNWRNFLHSKAKVPSKLPTKKPDLFKPQSEAIKVDPYRNLIVAALNKLVEGNYISLLPNTSNIDQESGHIFLDLFGEPSVILWIDGGFDELIISVWWKYDHSKHPQANLEGNARENFNMAEPLADKRHYKKFVGIVTRCWLERRNGQYLQGKNRDYVSVTYTRKGELDHLKKLPIQNPLGYKSFGPFHM